MLRKHSKPSPSRNSVKPSKCIEWWRSKHRNGYGQAYDRFEKKQVLAHRLIWQECFGPIPVGMFVLHRCDNRSCVNPEHLFLGSHQDNMTDMLKKGRSNSPRGEEKWCAKLTQADVEGMRKQEVLEGGEW